MARTSSISKHPKRKEIDKALVAPGASIRGIARTFRVSEDALSRYVKGGHIAEKVAKAQHAQDIVEADDLLKEIQGIEKTTEDIITAAMNRQVYDRDGNLKPADHETALKALARREKQIELKGKVLGAFKDNKPQPDPNKISEIPDEEIEKRAREILAKRRK